LPLRDAARAGRRPAGDGLARRPRPHPRDHGGGAAPPAALDRSAREPPGRGLAALPRLPRLAGALDPRGLPHLTSLDPGDRGRPPLPPDRHAVDERDPARAQLLEAAPGGRLRPATIASVSWRRTHSCSERGLRASPPPTS